MLLTFQIITYTKSYSVLQKLEESSWNILCKMKLCYECCGNCDGNKNICEAIVVITFPCKQTIMKYDMNKFNLTQFECRIQKPINLPVNKKKLNIDVFLLPLLF